MMTTRQASERGHTDIGWLDSHHTFSFGDYFDREAMGFRSLRVINDDRVAGGAGFGSHPHRDMEILTYVLEGALGHKDSMGNGAVIRPGEIQRMTAGTGVVHSEKNASAKEPVHFLQIWIVPEKRGLTPGYEQRPVPEGKLSLMASRDGRDGAVTVHQDVELWRAKLAAGEDATVTLRPGRHAWVHVARGRVRLGDEWLSAGDGVAISGEQALTLRAEEAAEALIFDLA
jgi:quercetin 2,3-dioxygenase